MCALAGAALLCPALAPRLAAEPLRITIRDAAGEYQVAAPGEVALYSTPVQFDVIPRQDFDARLEQLGGVLERTLGVQVQTSGGLGSFSSVSLRGASSEQVLIYLDGVPLNDAAGGAVDLSAVALEQLERIEVYRGATPVQLGGASLGGAVNLVSRRAQDGAHYRVTAGAGSFGTRQLSASANLAGARDRALLSTSQLASDNDFEITNDNGTAFNRDDDFDEHRNNADFRQQNLLARWQRQLADPHEFSITAQGFKKRQGLPDRDNSAQAAARFDTESLRLHTRMDLRQLGTGATSASAGAVAERKRETFDDRRGQIGLNQQHTLSTTGRIALDGFVNHNLGDTTLRGVAEAGRESYRFEDLRGMLRDAESTRESLILGGEWNRYLLHNRLIVSAVGRQQWVEDKLDVLGADVANEPVDERRSHSFFSPQLGAKYVLNANSHVKANLGRYARIPAFFELFGDRGFFLGNAGIGAETGINFDLGAQYEWFAPARWHHGALLRTEYFYNRADDLIVRVFNSRGVGRSENVSGATLQGISLALSATPAAGVEIGLGADWLDTRNDSDLTAFDGKRLPGRFARTLRLDAAWQLTAWRAALEVLRRDGMYFDAANLLPARDSTITNLSLRYGASAWRAELRIDNVFDERSEDFNGFPKPGTAVLATVTADF